ncbi:hypothetical protein WR25_23622 [Diploscapter pachys]|uniref:GYF domain-containing protein n=1 Tax=Diploscapter pachys TaxID=2018661 RepID=A0A2A2J7A2_9BILA|nr:hypothetical protein WR25_23622 [Diploscapter pachys]
MIPPPLFETKWYYFGPDNEAHGPYTNREMFIWRQSGYFHDNLPIRTENEESYHTLGDWIKVCSQSPFILNIHSMAQTVDRFNRAGALLHIPIPVPPGLPPGLPIPTNLAGFPRFPCIGSLPSPRLIPGQYYEPGSKPPSEPNDARNNLSNSPESEVEQMVNGRSQRNAYAMAEPPKLKSVSTSTDPPPTTKDSETQTMAIRVSSKDASQLLSDLLKINVQIQ